MSTFGRRWDAQHQARWREEHSLKCIHGIPSLDCMKCPNIRSTQIPRKPKMPESFPATSTIFTNLDDVLVNGLRLNCHAVVVRNDPDLHEGKHRRYDVTGYGTSCIWKVFDMQIDLLGDIGDPRALDTPNPLFRWTPRGIEQGPQGQVRRGHLRVAPVHGDQSWLDLELIATYPGTRDLGIQVTTIEGAWTPGQIDGDWAKHCHNVHVHVYDSAMKAVEATAADGHSPMNALVAMAGPPNIFRQMLDETGSQISGKKA